MADSSGLHLPSSLFSMDIMVGVLAGIGLAAACGFRVFVPLLATSLAARADLLTLGDQFDWLTNTPTLAVLAVATLLEIGAYYIPWVDNLLDTVAAPAAVVAGVMVSAAVITGMDPVLQWSLAAIAGGGAAGTVQAASSFTRLLSTSTTGGFGNGVVSTGELGGAATLSVLAVVAPVLAAIAVAVLLYIALRVVRTWRKRRRQRAAQGAIAGP